VKPVAATVLAGPTLATWRLLIDSGVMQEGEPPSGSYCATIGGGNEFGDV